MTRLSKLLVLFLFGLVLSLSFVCAQNETAEEDFTVELKAVKSMIDLEGLAEFDLTITNNLEIEESFRVYSLSGPNWEILTKPRMNPIIVDIEPNSSETIKIFVDPLHVTTIGKYIVDINVKSQKTEGAVKKQAQVSIGSTSSLIKGYVPTVTVNVNMPSTIDPREMVPIKITLKNQNILDYEELTLKIESNIIKKEFKGKLGPKEEWIIEHEETLERLTEPQKDIVQVTLFYGDKRITGPLVQAIEVIEYSDIKEEVVRGFLKVKKEVTVSSNNPDFKGPVKIEVRPLGSLFTSTFPRAKLIREDGKKYYNFDVRLENNVMKITISENYAPLFVVVILALIAAGLYLIYRSPLVIRKTLQSVEKKEGGISQLKVVLNVRNRSKKPIQDIEITESVPNIVDVEKELHLGILQPSKILRHEKKGSIIKWNVDDLGANEERVISYRIKSRFLIIGDFTLESTFARFRHEGKEKVTRSNTLSVA